MEQDEHKRNILIIAATITAIILLVGANIAFILTRPSTAPQTAEPSASPSMASTPSEVASSGSPSAVEHQKPLEVCETLAPKATAAYTGRSADRDALIRQYFADGAQGLNIPADRIQPQPDVDYSGGLNTGDSTNATCSVWTGLESPWTLTWRWDNVNGWLCTGINGPLEGAYETLGDKAPQEGTASK